MRKVKVLYCIDGYNAIEIPIEALSELLSTFQKIAIEASSVIKIIFTADVAVEGAGRISVGLNQKCILAYTSEDSEETLTSLGDEDAEGDTRQKPGQKTWFTHISVPAYYITSHSSQTSAKLQTLPKSPASSSFVIARQPKSVLPRGCCFHIRL